MEHIQLVIALLFLFSPALTDAKTGNCSLDYASISYTDDYDYELACESINRTNRYLK